MNFQGSAFLYPPSLLRVAHLFSISHLVISFQQMGETSGRGNMGCIFHVAYTFFVTWKQSSLNLNLPCPSSAAFLKNSSPSATSPATPPSVPTASRISNPALNCSDAGLCFNFGTPKSEEMGLEHRGGTECLGNPFKVGDKHGKTQLSPVKMLMNYSFQRQDWIW